METDSELLFSRLKSIDDSVDTLNDNLSEIELGDRLRDMGLVIEEVERHLSDMNTLDFGVPKSTHSIRSNLGEIKDRLDAMDAKHGQTLLTIKEFVVTSNNNLESTNRLIKFGLVILMGILLVSIF